MRRDLELRRAHNLFAVLGLEGYVVDVRTVLCVLCGEQLLQLSAMVGCRASGSA